MLGRSLILAAVIAAAGAAATPAAAGCCCASPCAVPVAPPVVVYEPYQMPEIYVVDRGPVYSGPGIYANPTVVYPHRMPAYPYVGTDYPGYMPPYMEPALRARGQVIRRHGW